jgi:hypothetical protein
MLGSSQRHMGEGASLMKRFVTQFLSLDIRSLSKGLWRHPNSRYQWIWRNKSGSVTGGIAITMLKHSVALCYYGEGRETTLDRVIIQYSLGARGGTRRWFECPGCKRRIAVLYKGEHGFQCRHCYGLKYESQYTAKGWSYGRRYQYLGDRLNGSCKMVPSSSVLYE